MPTPFNHLALADQLMTDPRLDPAVRDRLERAQGSFLFGNTAPDAGVLSGQKRAETHFFQVPMKPGPPAHQRLLARHAELGEVAELTNAHACFVAGYLAHLWLDQAWIATLFEPYFGPTVQRDSFHQRLIDHNLLRAYLDAQDLPKLSNDLPRRIADIEPEHWLPFASDQALLRWRDHLVEQLRPGGRAATVEIFATRLGISPESFALRLASNEEMEQAVFQFVSEEDLAGFQGWGLAQSIELVSAYLSGELPDAPSVNRTFQKRPISQILQEEGVP